MLKVYTQGSTIDEEFPGLRVLKSYPTCAHLDMNQILDLSLVQIGALSDVIYKREDL